MIRRPWISRRAAVRAAILAGLALALFSLPARAESTADRIGRIADEYRGLMGLAGEREALGMALGKAAETWYIAAEDLSARLGAEKARGFLIQALTAYDQSIARSDASQNVQLAGLNLLYQSVDAMAMVLAAHDQDQEAMDMIKETERRILAVAGKPGQEGPAMSALSGGVMTMLALVAGRVDRDGKLSDVLSGEFLRRREVDENIAALKDASPREKILLLTNNHLQGTLSMIQIIGLAGDSGLRSELGRIEKELIKSKDKSLDEQILAAAAALAEAGFLAAPTLARFNPDES